MKQFVQNTKEVSNHYKGLSQHKEKCKDAILENHSIDDAKLIISAIYEEAVKWKKSLLMLSIWTGSKNYTDDNF